MPTPLQHVRVDLSSLYIGVSEELLNGANVVAALDEMRRERMAERMGRGTFVDPGFLNGDLHRTRQAGRVSVMSAPTQVASDECIIL